MFTVRITPTDRSTPPGKLADAELHFGHVRCAECHGSGVLTVATSGPLAGATGRCASCGGSGIGQYSPLAGLKLIGFAVWERRGGSGRNVTFPARQYSVNGERRSFALLRPIEDPQAQTGIRDRILEAYAEYEAQLAEAV